MSFKPRALAIYSLKGGVGKTTAAVSLAYLAAAAGRETLLWDLDSQGAASYCLRVRPKVKGGASALVKGDEAIRRHVKETDYPGLDLMPADFSYRKLEALLLAQAKPRKLLGKLLEVLVSTRLGGYELVIFDCPPGPSLVAESVFKLADLVAVPIIPTPLSLRAQVQLEEYWCKRGLDRARTLPFFSMVDRRRRLHRETVDTWCETHDGPPPVAIPYTAQVENMALLRAPFPSFGGATPAGAAFRTLWDDVSRRLFEPEPEPD